VLIHGLAARATIVVFAITVALTSAALKERTEEGFPLTFAETKRVLGDQLERGVDIDVRFAVTNPTDAPVTYFLKPSSKRARVTHEHIEIAPGETQEIEIEVKTPMAGPFRHRIGVIVEPMRAALFIEGTVVY
jgi:hypothetical protein